MNVEEQLAAMSERVRQLENRDALYGPVLIGGPCTQCGQPNHMPLSCEQAKEEQQATIRRILKGIVPTKGDDNGNIQS